VAVLRTSLGSALEQILRTRDGRLVAIVADGTAPGSPPGGALVLGAQGAAALTAFGEASPLAGAEQLFASPSTSTDSPEVARRQQALAAAERKLAAARILLGAGQPGEALALVHGALCWCCRAAGERDPGDDPAALLLAVYGELVPGRALTPADAHALARAGELARAFSGSPLPPPPELVDSLLIDATQLLARLHERLAPASPGLGMRPSVRPRGLLDGPAVGQA
jgi:hypothetical protein